MVIPPVLRRRSHSQAYHSSYLDFPARSLGNFALLPLKSKIRGPAPQGGATFFAIPRLHAAKSSVTLVPNNRNMCSALISRTSHGSLHYVLPSSAVENPEEDDIVDEALNLFRANCFFRNFEIKGDADRVLVYLILYIQDCLSKLAKSPPQQQAVKDLAALAQQNFAVPGEPAFPLNAMYQAPASRADQ
ncbi:MAG: actin-related protein 2/3 complex subunit 3, partial [Olpidium bornovanus]